jgi:hypothetical protein
MNQISEARYILGTIEFQRRVNLVSCSAFHEECLYHSKVSWGGWSVN